MVASKTGEKAFTDKVPGGHEADVVLAPPLRTRFMRSRDARDTAAPKAGNKYFQKAQKPAGADTYDMIHEGRGAQSLPKRNIRFSL